MENDDFSTANALFAEYEARRELEVLSAARAAFARGQIAKSRAALPTVATALRALIRDMTRWSKLRISPRLPVGTMPRLPLKKNSWRWR